MYISAQCLVELLEARLASFRERWGSGDLQARGFTRTEVLHLVEALFEDTDVRRDVCAFLRTS